MHMSCRQSNYVLSVMVSRALQDDLSQDPTTLKWSCCKCDGDVEAVVSVRVPLMWVQPGTMPGENAICWMITSAPVSLSVLGDKYKDYATMDAEAKQEAWAPMFGQEWYLYATVRKQATTITSMISVNYSAGVNQRA